MPDIIISNNSKGNKIHFAEDAPDGKGGQFASIDDAASSTSSPSILNKLKNIDLNVLKGTILSVKNKEMTTEEYSSWSKKVYDSVDPKDANAFNEYIKGTSDLCFDFYKSLRLGFDKFYKLYPNYLEHGMLTPQKINEVIERLDRATTQWAFPEGINATRYINSGPILNWFKNSGILEGFNTRTNKYGYQVIKGNGEYSSYHDEYLLTSTELNDICAKINNAKGFSCPGDGAYTSVSLVKDATHMGKEKEKQFVMKIAMKKGQTGFPGGYNYESEMLLPRTTAYRLLYSKVERFPSGDKVVLYVERTD